MRLSFVPIAIVAMNCVSSALASSSSWHTTEGARLRVVTVGKPDADGMLQGALQIDLRPGWKTYWRDPGGSGVPPSIDISGSTNIGAAVLSYPPPMRFKDESGPWNGYKHSVTLAVNFELIAPGATTAIVAEVFIGVCETVCVPVQATLIVDPVDDPDNFDDAITIKRAVAALPAEAGPEFGATLVSHDKEGMDVAVAFTGDAASVELFVAGADGYSLGVPIERVTDGAITFRVPILDRPPNSPSGNGLPYTLVNRTGAVQGYLRYP